MHGLPNLNNKLFILLCLFGLTTFSQKVSSQKGIVILDTVQKTTHKSIDKTVKKQPHYFQQKLDSLAETDISLIHLNQIFEIQNDTVSKNLQLFKTDAVTSYYADKFHGRRTASGKIFDNKKFTAAHKTLPFGTRLKVTNQANGKSVEVIVIDRGPFTKGRELDLSKAAFLEITRGIKYGLLRATIEIIE